METLAFPPAPHHTFRGMVRDDRGDPVTATDAKVIFHSEVGVSGHATVHIERPIVFGLGETYNYMLPIPMDAGISPEQYAPTALRPELPFTIVVTIGTRQYLPIEMALTTSKLGRPGGVTVLDLTLGEDTDRDGLPDNWERAVIQGVPGYTSLDEVNPHDDSDGDGLTNLQEYIAGTFAFDGQDEFTLDLTRFSETGNPCLKFLALRGRTYTVQGAGFELKTWHNVTFQIPGSETSESSLTVYQSSDVHEVEIEVPMTGDQANYRFFKLIVN